MPIFVSYRLIDSLKTCASIAHYVVGNAVAEVSLILMGEIVFVNIHKSRIFVLSAKVRPNVRWGKDRKSDHLRNAGHKPRKRDGHHTPSPTMGPAVDVY